MKEDSKFLKGFLVGLIVAAAGAALLIFCARDYLFSASDPSEYIDNSEVGEDDLEVFHKKLNSALGYISEYY